MDCSAIPDAPRARHRALPHVAASRQSRIRYNSARTGNAPRAAAVSSIDRYAPSRSAPASQGSCNGSRDADPGLAQGPPQIVTQVEERSPARCLTPDQDQIDAGDRPGYRIVGQFQPRGFLQAAPCPVANDRATDLLGDREADPRRTVIVAPQSLQDQSVRRRFAALRGGAQELRTTFQPDLAQAHLGQAVWGRGEGGHELGAARRGNRADGRWSSGGQPLTALGTAVGEHPAAAHGGHAGAEPVAVLADKLRRLIGAFHDNSPGLLYPR